MAAKMPISYCKGNSLHAYNSFAGWVCQSIQTSCRALHLTLSIYADTWMKLTDQVYINKQGGLVKIVLFKSTFTLVKGIFNKLVTPTNGCFNQLKVIHLLRIRVWVYRLSCLLKSLSHPQSQWWSPHFGIENWFPMSLNLALLLFVFNPSLQLLLQYLIRAEKVSKNMIFFFYLKYIQK